MNKNGLTPARQEFLPFKRSAEIPYSVRISNRARRVSIRVRPYVGLEVVVPKRFPHSQIENILQHHQAWITAQLDKHADTFAAIPLPDQIKLALTGEIFEVEFDYANQSRVIQQKNKLQITLPDPQTEPQQVIDLLRGWIRGYARKQLCPRLQELALEFGLNYNKCSIRSQKSRWGSCSSNGTISLNDQLLFMPPDTVDYLLIHELCHTRHMNHSPAFWNLVARHVPEYRAHEQALDQGRTRVPAWFLSDLLRNR